MRWDETKQWLVVSGQWPVLSTQYSVLSTQYSVLSTRYSVLSTQYSVLSTQLSVPTIPKSPSKWPVASGQWSVTDREQWLVAVRGLGAGDVGRASEHYPLPTTHYPRPSSLVPRPLSPVPSRSAFRLPPSAFTLIEMLIVVSIILVLMTVAMTMMKPAGESRRIREAARAINVYLSSARNHAMETGRPCGVTFHNFVAGGSFSMNADQCEVPPTYAGDMEQSTAQVTNTAGVFSGTLSDTGLPASLVRIGDQIQFNYQGPSYIISGPNDGNGFVATGTNLQFTQDPTQNPLAPWTATPSPPVPYCILRAPVKGGAAPLQLPAATVVDFTASGVDPMSASPDLFHEFSVGGGDVEILFSPNGGVDSLYVNNMQYVPTSPIYLLIGKRERVVPGIGFIQANANETTMTNYQDLNNLWITVNPLSGLINTEPVANSIAGTDLASAITAARALAAQAQGMGGK